MKAKETIIEQNGLIYKCQITEYGVNVQVPGGYIYAKDMNQAKEYIEKYYGNTYAADYTEPATTSANDGLKFELQQYYDDASKGGTERRRNMILLRWDIRRLENEIKKTCNNKKHYDYDTSIS